MGKPRKNLRRALWIADAALAALFAWLLWISFADFAVRLPESLVAEAPRHPVTLYLSNQSLQQPFVRLSVELDGREIARPTLFVGLGHIHRTATLELPEGSYAIAVACPSKGVRKEVALEVRGPVWVAGFYWHQDDETEVALDVTDMPPQFL